MSVVSSCSSYKPVKPVIESRTVASADYVCSFKEGDLKMGTQYNFSPSKLNLAVVSEKYGSEVVYLEEDSFIKGGFSFVMDKKEKAKKWLVKKVNFVSFTSRPEVAVTFSRTPASQKELTVQAVCE